MTPSLLRLCAALAPIVSWTFVAPASQNPTATASGISQSSPRSSMTVNEPPLAATATEFDASYLASAVSVLSVEQTPIETVHPWRRLLKREVTPGIVARANAIIRAHSVIGDEVPFTVAGEHFLARIEEHYHPPGGDKFPWGPHPGVSVFVARPPAAP